MEDLKEGKVYVSQDMLLCYQLPYVVESSAFNTVMQEIEKNLGIDTAFQSFCNVIHLHLRGLHYLIAKKSDIPTDTERINTSCTMPEVIETFIEHTTDDQLKEVYNDVFLAAQILDDMSNKEKKENAESSDDLKKIESTLGQKCSVDEHIV